MLSCGELDAEGLDEDVQKLVRYKDDGTVEVHRWINDVEWNDFHGRAKVCKYCDQEKEDVPAMTRKAIAIIWQGSIGGRRSKQRAHEEHHVEEHRFLEAHCEL